MSLLEGWWRHTPPTQAVPAGEVTLTDCEKGAYYITDVSAQQVIGVGDMPDSSSDAPVTQVLLYTKALEPAQRPEDCLMSITGNFPVAIDTHIQVTSRSDEACE